MDIHCKRVYLPPDDEDGVRFLVDRVWPRGMTREQVRADHWLREVAPSTALRRWFGHEHGRWVEFRQRYHAELDANSTALAPLRALAVRGRVTLLYAARDAECNHALVLREHLLARPAGGAAG